jgi:catechol-2,3-dioxygenase
VDIIELRLATNRLPELRDFYLNTLDFTLLDDGSDRFALAAGETRLVFAQDDTVADPIYHVAFNIPENQYAEAKAWLLARVPLLTWQDKDEVAWSAWNAHALYFFDPAGNIMEFIARHNLPNAASESFSSRNLCQVSEIGLAVANVREASEALQAELSVGVFDAGDGVMFRALGDERGLFIMVKQGRAWFPTSDRRADFYPLALTLRGTESKRYTLPDLPYQFSVQV